METLGKTKLSETAIAAIVAALFFIMAVSLLIGYATALESDVPPWPRLAIIFGVNIIIDFFIVLVSSSYLSIISWSDEGIFSESVITKRRIFISWKEALICRDKYDGYTISNMEGKKVKVNTSCILPVNKDLLQFVTQHWENYMQDCREKINYQGVVLWEEDNYQSKVYKDKLYINREAFQLDRIKYIWEVKPYFDPAPQYQLLTLGFEHQGDLSLRIHHFCVDPFVNHLKNLNSDLKVYNKDNYHSLKDDTENKLSEDESIFCLRQHQKEGNWTEILFLCMILGGIYSQILYSYFDSFTSFWNWALLFATAYLGYYIKVYVSKYWADKRDNKNIGPA